MSTSVALQRVLHVGIIHHRAMYTRLEGTHRVQTHAVLLLP